MLACLLCFLIYILALLDSNYGGLLESRAILNSAGIRWSLNLPAALIWVVIGKILADKPIMLQPRSLHLILVAAVVLYVTEAVVIHSLQISVHSDCFLTSISLCTLIFIAIGHGRAKDKIWIESFCRTIKYDYIYIPPEENGAALYQGIDR